MQALHHISYIVYRYALWRCVDPYKRSVKHTRDHMQPWDACFVCMCAQLSAHLLKVLCYACKWLLPP